MLGVLYSIHNTAFQLKNEQWKRTTAILKKKNPLNQTWYDFTMVRKWSANKVVKSTSLATMMSFHLEISFTPAAYKSLACLSFFEKHWRRLRYGSAVLSHLYWRKLKRGTTSFSPECGLGSTSTLPSSLSCLQWFDLQVFWYSKCWTSWASPMEVRSMEAP